MLCLGMLAGGSSWWLFSLGEDVQYIYLQVEAEDLAVHLLRLVLYTLLKLLILRKHGEEGHLLMLMLTLLGGVKVALLLALLEVMEAGRRYAFIVAFTIATEAVHAPVRVVGDIHGHVGG